MTPERIADSSPDDLPYTHLLPLVEAEVRWGNSTYRGFVHDRREDVWTAHFTEPLHLDRLRAEFDLPPSIRTRTTPDGGTFLWDDVGGAGLSGSADVRVRLDRPGRSLLTRLLRP